MKRWHFSLALGGIYLGVFHLWMHLDRPAVVVTALLATALAGGLFLRAECQSYFRNLWDRLFHGAVILDILLEGILIPRHDQHGFYLCAIAFGVVLGGYRGWALHRQRTLNSQSQ